MAYTAEEKIYVNADRSAVVPEGSTEAAYLLVGPGGTLTDEDCKKYGLGRYASKKSKAEEKEPEAEEKQAEPAENKMAPKAENKMGRRKA